MSYQVGKFIRRGKVNELFEALDGTGTPVSNRLIIRRLNDITAGDGEVRDSIDGKGAIINNFSNLLFQLLDQNGIPNHFVEQLNDNDTVVERLDMLKVEAVGRNLAAGSLLKRLPFRSGHLLKPMLFEMFLKDDDWHDPLLNNEHAIALGLVRDEAEIRRMRELTSRANDVLSSFFASVGITLVDFKFEFGRNAAGNLVLADEISPDTCRFWDAKTGESFDKDVFRTGKGNEATLKVYNHMMERLHAAVQ